MHRIFPILVLLAVGFFAATMVVGFRVDTTPPPGAVGMPGFTLHFLTGLTTALIVMFANGLVVTYFIGTSRWCREVVIAYRLPVELAQESHRLKRRTFPFSLGNMLLIIGGTALGAAAHTMSHTPGLAGLTWAELHFLGAAVTLAFMALATYVQWVNIRANQQIISQILDEVRAIRVAKGLD